MERKRAHGRYLHEDQRGRRNQQEMKASSAGRNYGTLGAKMAYCTRAEYRSHEANLSVITPPSAPPQHRHAL
jgi:hypothetical protein